MSARCSPDILTESAVGQSICLMAGEEKIETDCESVPLLEVSALQPGAKQRRPWRRIALLIEVMITRTVVAMSATVLTPFYPQETYKWNEKEEASKFTGYLLGGVLMFNVVAGVYVGHWGIQQVGCKFWVVTGLFLSGGCAFLFSALDYATSWGDFYGLSIVIGLVWGFGGGATDVAAVTIGTTRFRENLGLTVGSLEMGLALGITFGPFLGGALYETGGFMLPLLVIGILLWSLSLLSYIVIPGNGQDCGRSHSRNRSESTSSVELARETLITVVSLFKNVWIVMTCVTVFLINSVRGLLGAALSAFLDQQYQLSPENIGFFFMVAAGTNALFAAPSGKLADKIGPRWCIHSGVLLVGGGCFTMAMGTSTAIQFGAMVIIGAGCGLALGTALAHMSSECLAPGAARSEQSMGLLTGMLAFFSAFGLVVGSVAGGLLSTEFGFRTTGLIWGCCCSGWGTLYCIVHVCCSFCNCIRS